MDKRTRQELTEDYKREAVRLTETSGRTVRQVAEDLGVGYSTLTRWRQQYREESLRSRPPSNDAAELARLRKENALLRQERDFLKKAAAFFAKESR